MTERLVHEPICLVVMGVAGSGKSTVAEALVRRTGWAFLEGDGLHPPANRAKMAAGTPLTDADRLPWLADIGAWISARHDEGIDSVATCSALRRSYRDLLGEGRPWVRFCFLDVPTPVLVERLARRAGHFFPADLLRSQLADLEPLEPDEPGFVARGTGPGAWCTPGRVTGAYASAKEADMAADTTVVEMLLDQHDHIRTLFDEVAATAGERRRESFEELRRFLAVHEAAEEIVTHPAVRKHESGIAEARLGEEHEAKERLAKLEHLDLASPDFDVQLAVLRTKVLDHAAHEEIEEFPVLLATCSPDELAQMADGLRAMEKVAPTHPHPVIGESAVANLMAGPVAALVDRTRDAVGAAMHRSG